MPSLLPAASLSQVQEVLARQDAAIAATPEVASVVGKAGRAGVRANPAPIGMLETIILLKPESQWRQITDEHGRQRRITKDDPGRAAGQDHPAGRAAHLGCSPSRPVSSCCKPASGR